MKCPTCGIRSPENPGLLSKGDAPTIKRGKYAGEECQVEHIVPRNVVPLMDNLLVNLEWLPQSLNARKSDTITPRALDYAQRYFDAGVMSFEDFSRVKSKAED